MPSARAIVAAAKNYRVARPHATANMIEDALREQFLGAEPAAAEWARSAAEEAELPFSGALGFLVGRVYENLFPLDRDTIAAHIKVAVQIALETDLPTYEVARARRTVRFGCRFAVCVFALAALIAFQTAWFDFALVLGFIGLAVLFEVGTVVGQVRALRGKQKVPRARARK